LLELIKGANLALRFLLELCALGALGYWGFKTGGGAIGKITLGVGAPLVAAVVWGTFLSPRVPVSYRHWSSRQPRWGWWPQATEPWRWCSGSSSWSMPSCCTRGGSEAP